MADFEDIRLETAGSIARITIARPDRLNAMRDRTADELYAAITACEDDPAIRALVLTGEGRAFGSGYDLSTVAPDTAPALDRVLEEHFNPLVRAIVRSRLPIICAVNGACAGAAVGIALAGDIVVATRSAYFYEPFAGIALVPDAGNTFFFPRIAGRARASAAMLLGDRIGAEEAMAWGLVWRIYDDPAFATEVDRIAARLASLAPAAVAATKRLVAKSCAADLDRQLDLERDLQGEAGRSPEMKDAIAAFFARRQR